MALTPPALKESCVSNIPHLHWPPLPRCIPTCVVARWRRPCCPVSGANMLRAPPSGRQPPCGGGPTASPPAAAPTGSTVAARTGPPPCRTAAPMRPGNVGLMVAARKALAVRPVRGPGSPRARGRQRGRGQWQREQSGPFVSTLGDRIAHVQFTHEPQQAPTQQGNRHCVNVRWSPGDSARHGMVYLRCPILP